MAEQLKEHIEEAQSNYRIGLNFFFYTRWHGISPRVPLDQFERFRAVF